MSTEYTPAERVLIHAVGADGRYDTVGWRRHFVASTGHRDLGALREAAARGWMRQLTVTGRGETWIATVSGIAHAAQITGLPIDEAARAQLGM